MLSQTSSPLADALSPATQRLPLNVLFGVPDDGGDAVRASADGRALLARASDTVRSSFTLRGSANLAPYLSPDRFALNRFYLQGGAGLRINLGPGPILNHIADPDICSQALVLAASILDQARRACFNHPSAIARTSRDGVARLLSAIPGLKVPKTIRVGAESIDDIAAAADEAKLCYPVLARIAGSHGGDDRIFVEQPASLPAIAALERKGRPLYLTEFCDFASPDGLYRKFRVVVVGDDVFLRHCVIGAHWSLHGGGRAPGAEDEEAHLLETFASEWMPAVKPVFSEMTRRLDLDYYGVDCHIDAQRNVLLFEANACMKVLKNYRPPPNRFEAPIARIKKALEARLSAPETWRTGARERG